jgi:hypothetical protein
VRFNQPLFFFVLLSLVAAARLCHVEILWAEETLPLAAAEQVLHGKTLYRDVWFDKPPLVAAVNLLWGARDRWPLRLAGALYQLLACWLAFRFARDLWSPAEGYWAAGLVGFFLTFDFPSAVIPLASDLLLVVPHLAAVWLAWKRRPFASGLWLGVGFLISPKALFVAAVCAVWYPSGVFWMAAGFLAATGVATLWLAAAGALPSYWDQVWRWGRVYASTPSLDRPVWNAMVRTADWAGFHIALLAAAIWYFGSGRKAGEPPAPRLWAGWCGLSLMAVATGFRFFPRYYFFLLPPLALAAARGSTLLGRRRVWIALLLLIPLARFGPRYALLAARHIDWVDTSMDRDSRSAAAVARPLAHLGSTLFVWGFRPELYVYTGLPAATRFLDSQPLTGVPADRHLTQSTPVETIFARAHRGELARSSPTFVMDGLGLYNPRLAITQFPELAEWFSHYREVGRVGGTVIYQVIPAPP